MLTKPVGMGIAIMLKEMFEFSHIHVEKGGKY